VRPVQVHGCGVADAARPDVTAQRADAIVSNRPGGAVGVVTADYVPLLAASASGRAVVAIHAGWRGLAAGVVERGLAALTLHAPGEPLTVAVGPHIGACCYEVDAPVLGALANRFGDAAVAAATVSDGRPGHARLSLADLVRAALLRSGVAPAAQGFSAAACTRCDRSRFHSFRRDGEAAGRLVHFVTARGGDDGSP